MRLKINTTFLTAAWCLTAAPLWAQEPVPAPTAEAEPAGVETPAPAEDPEVAAAAPAVVAPNLNGAWSGSWSSYCNRHHGPMQATFFQIDACHYQVHFRGRFFKLIPFNYTVVLTVTGVENGKVYLGGSHRLGPILGTFSFNAWATDTQFVAGYCSADDRGQFVLNRCCR